MPDIRNVLKKVLPDRAVDLYRVLRYPVETYAVIRGPVSYNQDGLATMHNADFLSDPLFKTSYELGEKTGSFRGNRVHWRAHVACWAATHAALLDGDFVECGVYRGGLARIIVNYISFQRLSKTFYLLDTFEGLVEKYISDEEKALGKRAGIYEECYDATRATFANFANVRLVRGPVPDTLPLVDAKRVAYLSLDMNCAPPEIAAAEYFWDKLVPGGIILLDDYGWPGYETQKRAFNKFAAERSTSVLSLPTGQGLILKP